MAHHPAAHPSPSQEEMALEIVSWHLPQRGRGGECELPRESVCSKNNHGRWSNSEAQCFQDRSLLESLGDTG